MPPPTELARALMQRALALAALGRGRTAPNPMVGCVVARGGRIVGEGWHRRAGEPHAEVLALRAAGEAARGATLYVTLEPCHHTGRTGPCTAAVRAAGVRRVVVAATDPDARVRGRGLRHLRAAGLDVEVGLLAEEACRLNAPYYRVKTTGLAYVVAKLAQSLDGCVATRTGASKWMTSEAAREVGHALRNRVDAVVVGRGTLSADDPRLTCRLAGGRDPARVVLASRAEVPRGSYLMRHARRAPTYVVVGPQAPAARRRRLEAAGVRVLQVPLGRAGVSLPRAMEALAGEGLHALLVEGGPTLLGGLFDAALVQRLYAFVAPRIVGGAARHSVAGHGVATPALAHRLRRTELVAVGEDWLLRADLEPSAQQLR